MSAPVSAARCDIDDAARLCQQADIALGDPGFDRRHIERLLLDAIKLVLNALALLGGAS